MSQPPRQHQASRRSHEKTGAEEDEEALHGQPARHQEVFGLRAGPRRIPILLSWARCTL